MLNLIKKSIAMRTGHNMHNFIKEPITTNVLSRFEAGIASQYYYALRIMSVVLGVTTGPLLQIYWAKTSKLFARNDFRGIKKLIRKTEPELLGLYIISAVAVLALISPMLTMLESRSLSHDDIGSIRALYMALIPLHVVGTFETPFGYVLVAAKAAVRVIFINSAYILLYGALVTLLAPRIGIYAIPIALFLAQSSNTTMIAISAARILDHRHRGCRYAQRPWGGEAGDD